MSVFSLDTDIITRLLKKHPGNQPVVDRFREEINRNSLFLICPVVYYEIRRELLLKDAAVQLTAFEKLVEAMAWKEFSLPIWRRASSLWSTLRARGLSHHDADVLIAAHALASGSKTGAINPAESKSISQTSPRRGVSIFLPEGFE
jgi:predicted nucleic acid-binding protein